MSNPSESEPWPTEVIVTLDERHVDERGEIVPLVDCDMKSALIISSNKGSIRANHYHKKDWHYCYVISGSIEYYHRPVGSSEAPEKITIHTGQLFFTPPMVEHAMVFPEDTVFLTLARNPRDQQTYEKDTVRVELVKP